MFGNVVTQFVNDGVFSQYTVLVHLIEYDTSGLTLEIISWLPCNGYLKRSMLVSTRLHKNRFDVSGLRPRLATVIHHSVWSIR